MKQSLGRWSRIACLASVSGVLLACSAERDAPEQIPPPERFDAPLAETPMAPTPEAPAAPTPAGTDSLATGSTSLEGPAPLPVAAPSESGETAADAGVIPVGPVPPVEGPVTPPLEMPPPVTAPPVTPPPVTPPPVTPPVTPPPVTPPPGDANLPPGVSSRFPRAGATGICMDVPLRLTFTGNVTLGNAGRIQIFQTGQANNAIDTVDMAATAFPDTIGGRAANRVRPVFLDGRDAVVYFRHNILQPNTSYSVSIDSGVFRDANGNALATTPAANWSFTTGAARGAAATQVVQREGQGNFCTVQGALDAIPDNNTAPVTINIQNGNYHEMLYLTRKNNVTLRGQNRDDTVITYPNNNNLNAGTAGRSMITALTTDDFVIDNLTLYNTTPQGGSQAEALRVRGNRSILRNSNFLSLQDTLLLEGNVYVVDSYIEGNVDFVWGQGAAYFERSEIKIVGRSGVIVQSRNPATTFGYVFVDSRLTSDPGLTNSQLARIDATVYPASHVAFINCQMGPHISAAGWTITPAGADTSGIRFWEFQSTDLQGQPLNVSQRLAGSRRISANEAAQMRNKAMVLGGWNPTP